jgi:spermidine/putrescine-binding protein
VDCWVIPVHAVNVKAASYWINFFSRPDNALRCMRSTNWTSAIATPEIRAAVEDSTQTKTVNASYFFGLEAAKAHVSPVLYPDLETIRRLALMRDVCDRQELVRDMWNQLKYQPQSDHIYLIVILAVLSLLLLLAILFVVRRNIRR